MRQLYGNTRLSGSAEIPRNLFLGHALQFFDGRPGTDISSKDLAGASSTGAAIASDNLPEPEKGGAAWISARWRQQSASRSVGICLQASATFAASTRKRQVAEFGQPPESRQHFD